MGEVLPKVTSLLEYMIMHNVEIFEVIMPSFIIVSMLYYRYQLRLG